MSEPVLTHTAKRGRSLMKRRIIPGVVVTLAVLGALEVGLRVIADGHSNPDVRLMALAFSLTAGALVGGLRGAGALVLLLGIAAASSAQAGDASRQYNVTISTSDCPSGTPGLLYDLKEPGLPLAGLRAWNLTVCPTSGQTFTGVGGWRACVFRRTPGPNQWVGSNLYFDMTDDGTGSPISTTVARPCHTFYDQELGVNDGDLVYVYPTTTLGVSAGTAVSVYLEGVFRGSSL
jgi:hypothetical protein